MLNESAKYFDKHCGEYIILFIMCEKLLCNIVYFLLYSRKNDLLNISYLIV